MYVYMYMYVYMHMYMYMYIYMYIYMYMYTYLQIPKHHTISKEYRIVLPEKKVLVSDKTNIQWRPLIQYLIASRFQIPRGKFL